MALILNRDHKDGSYNEKMEALFQERSQYRESAWFETFTDRTKAAPPLILKPASGKVTEEDFTELINSLLTIPDWRQHRDKSNHFAAMSLTPNNAIFAGFVLHEDENFVGIGTYLFGEIGERARKAGIMQLIRKYLEEKCQDKYTLCISPCYRKFQEANNLSAKCIKPLKDLVLDEKTVACAICPENGYIMSSSEISKWLPDVPQVKSLQLKTIDKYLTEVSRLINSQHLMVDIGLELGWNFKDIETVLNKNNNQAFAACKLLINWRKQMNLSDIEEVKQRIETAYNACQIGDALKDLNI